MQVKQRDLVQREGICSNLQQSICLNLLLGHQLTILIHIYLLFLFFFFSSFFLIYLLLQPYLCNNPIQYICIFFLSFFSLFYSLKHIYFHTYIISTYYYLIFLNLYPFYTHPNTMSNPQQDQAQGRRKSSRQRVPNAYYTAGINELKKITLKTQTKKNRNSDQDDISDEEDRNISNNHKNHHQNYSAHQKQQTTKWLPCILPRTNKHIKVQIVVDSSLLPAIQPLKQKEQPPAKQSFYISEPQPVIAPSFNSGGQISRKSQPQGALNLLSLFQKVIKNVSDEVPSPVKHPSHHNQNAQVLYNSSNLEQQNVKQTTSQKQAKVPVLAPPPKRQIEQDKDGRINSCKVQRQTKKILINHSKLGQCQVAIEADPASWSTKQDEMTEEESLMVSDWKKKLQMNPLLLKSIALFN